MIGSSTRVATAVWVGNVTGEANLRDLSFDSGAAATARHRMWPAIMSVADQKYGGDAFPDAPSSAFRQVLVDLPNLAGLTLDQARQALEEAGFQFADGGQRDSDLPVGQVMASEPSGQAGRGSVVTVFTSNGKLKALPNVVGQSLQQATATLTAAGFSVTGNGNGNVTAMSPAAGTPAAPGTVVTLTVGGGGNGNGNGNQGNDG
ncbi:PASTA domain-containing protein [Agromyces atrinae]|nr:PASTA domain-containing protein [Agromyces atrinae]MCI2959692.1 PASTA domain-containing protein [Agromyces atrinae]